jgi:hypothetical protein
MLAPYHLILELAVGRQIKYDVMSSVEKLNKLLESYAAFFTSYKKIVKRTDKSVSRGWPSI